jgi:hypothetical protein
MCTVTVLADLELRELAFEDEDPVTCAEKLGRRSLPPKK